MHTLHAYVTFIVKEEEDVDNFLATWEKKLDDTITSGLDISDKLQRCLLLSALPSSWSSFVTTQNLNKKATVEDLMGDIRQEDSMRKTRRKHINTSNRYGSLSTSLQTTSKVQEFQESVD